MASIKDRVSDLMKSSLKSGDKATLGYARNLFSAIRKREIDERKDITDEDIQTMISSLVKQRNESIEQFTQGGRDELAANEKAELEFLLQFMPKQLTEEEVRTLVESAIKESGAESMKDLGKVMKILVPQTKGKADGKWVSQLVREALG